MEDGKTLGIYIHGTRIECMAPTPYPVTVEKVTEQVEDKEFTFDGLFVKSDPDVHVQLIYTTRRKGTVYLKAVDHPTLMSISTNDPETYKLFDGIKRGTKLNGTFTIK